MPVFNFASAYGGRSGKGSAETYSLLLDSLSREEDRLSSDSIDGKMNQKEIDTMIGKYQNAALNGALNEGQRSNFLNGVERLKKIRSVSGLQKSSDIELFNRMVKDDFNRSVAMYANSPIDLLQDQVASVQGKISAIETSIERMDRAGDDSTQHRLELIEAYEQNNDLSQALSDAQQFETTPGDKPSSAMVAYVTTNPRGEVNDIKIGRVGSQKGYAQTNGVLGGFQVYGKVNSPNGMFKLGNKTFQIPDFSFVDPSNPEASGAKFIDTSMISPDQSAESPPFSVIDAGSLRPQGKLRVGDWGVGKNGSLYQKKENGSYKKYLNTNAKDLGLEDRDMFSLPEYQEDVANNFTDEFHDGSVDEPYPSGFIGPLPAGSERVGPSVSEQQQPQPQGTPRTPQPTSRAPQSASGIAGSALDSAKGFLGRLFGRG